MIVVVVLLLMTEMLMMIENVGEGDGLYNFLSRLERYRFRVHPTG